MASAANHGWWHPLDRNLRVVQKSAYNPEVGSGRIWPANREGATSNSRVAGVVADFYW
jgi:hypothetical protein